MIQNPNSSTKLFIPCGTIFGLGLVDARHCCVHVLASLMVFNFHQHAYSIFVHNTHFEFKLDLMGMFHLFNGTWRQEATCFANLLHLNLHYPQAISFYFIMILVCLHRPPDSRLDLTNINSNIALAALPFNITNTSLNNSYRFTRTCTFIWS